MCEDKMLIATQKLDKANNIRFIYIISSIIYIDFILIPHSNTEVGQGKQHCHGYHEVLIYQLVSMLKHVSQSSTWTSNQTNHHHFQLCVIIAHLSLP